MNEPTELRAPVEAKRRYVLAGAIALGFAALIQFASGGLGEEMLADLPEIVTVPHGVAGKLALTIPLARLGLVLIVRGVRTTATRATAAEATAPGAEPFAEEIPDTPAGQTIPAKFKTPSPASAPTPFRSTDSGGTVALNSAKYLNGSKPDFREGHINETTD